MFSWRPCFLFVKKTEAIKRGHLNVPTRKSTNLPACYNGWILCPLTQDQLLTLVHWIPSHPLPSNLSFSHPFFPLLPQPHLLLFYLADCFNNTGIHAIPRIWPETATSVASVFLSPFAYDFFPHGVASLTASYLRQLFSQKPPYLCHVPDLHKNSISAADTLPSFFLSLTLLYSFHGTYYYGIYYVFIVYLVFISYYMESGKNFALFIWLSNA